MSQFNDELVINYHITEVCNYSCQFCYAKWDRPNEIYTQGKNAELMLEKLASYFFNETGNKVKDSFPYKSVRINFAGGEPLILKDRFAQLVIKAKELGLVINDIFSKFSEKKQRKCLKKLEPVRKHLVSLDEYEKIKLEKERLNKGLKVRFQEKSESDYKKDNGHLNNGEQTSNLIK